VQLAAGYANAAEGKEADEARWHGDRGGEQLSRTAHQAITTLAPIS